ncbi:LapA family protein [Qipengyuania nanhaisediminis]|uniref:LapA family protein n=1 Tax=Qipengyuania nanhaisediminis TaxID=604088 RepID=UPI0038B2F777
MQILRTIIWVLILFGMLTFSFFNWDTVEVNLWENLVLETKVPMLVIVAFLLGLVPMWLYHRSVKWSLSRRIRSLEASIKSTALSHRHEEAHTHDPYAAPGNEASATTTTSEPQGGLALDPASSEDKPSA